MRFLIVGCGRMGAGLACVLAEAGHTVTVMDKDRELKPNPMFRGRSLVGSAFDRDALLEAGIGRADGLAAMTGSDEVNLVLARLARQVFRVPKVVARLVDPGKTDMYLRLGVQTVAPVPWAIRRFADLLCYSELDALLSLGGGEVELIEAVVPSLLVGRKVSAVDIPGEARVVAVSRRGKAFLPSSETVFEKNDSVHVAVLTASIERLKALLTVG